MTPATAPRNTGFTAAVVAAGLVVGVVGIAGPASAIPVGSDTVTTFTIGGGTLEIGAPSSAHMGTYAAANMMVQGTLGK